MVLGGWHFLPKAYYDQHQLRAEESIIEFDRAFQDYDTIVYFHGNALNRAGPWRIEFYKVFVYAMAVVNVISSIIIATLQ